MSFLTTSDTVTSFPEAGGDLSSTSVLRLVRSGSKPQSWSLPLGRCTLGSSRQCQIYLPDDQVRPLHCLIVHNADKTLVTRWAPGVLLNGEDFSTVPFQPGDQLTIGNIELQLVADDTQTPPTEPQGAAPTIPMEVAPTPLPSAEQERPVSPPQPAVMPTAKSAEEPAGVVSPRGERDRKVRRLWLANFNARSRCRQLIGSMRELRTQSADFDQQIGGLHRQLHLALDERQQLAGELEQRQAEIVERDQQATAEMDRLIGELSAACELVNASESAASEQVLASERLREEIATLASQHEQLELAQAQDEQNRILLSQELADRDLKVEQLQRQFEQTEASKIFSAKQAAELVDTLERLQHELDQQQTEREGLAAEQASLGDQLRGLEQNLADREHTIGDLRQQLEQSEESGNANANRSGELADTVERLQAELDRERTEREGLAAEQASLGDQLRGLEQNLADLHQQLEQAQESVRQIEEQSAKYVITIEDLHVELEQKDDQRAHLEELQSEFTGQRQELEESLAERDRAIEDLQRQLHEADQAANIAREGEATHADTIETLQAKWNQQQAELETLLVAEANAPDRLKELEKALAERERQLEELRQEHKDVCQTLHSLEQGSFEQVDAYMRLEEELVGLCTERDELAAVQSGHDGQLRALEEGLTQRDRAIEELNEQLSAVTQRRAEMESEVAQHAESYHRLEVEVDELHARCQTLADEQIVSRSQQHELQQSVTGYEEHIGALAAELESARQEHQALQKATEEQSDSREVLIAELAELQELHEDANQKYEAEFERRQTADQTIAKREHRIELLEVDLRSAQAENKQQFSETLALLEQTRATGEEQVTELREELKNDKTLLEDRTMELETARQELVGLQQQSDTASNESNTLSEQLVALEQEKSALEKSLETEQGLVSELSSELEQTRDQPPTAGLSEDLKPELPDLVANDRAAEEAIEHLRELSVWSDEEKPSALEDDNQAAEAETEASMFKPTSFIDQHSHLFDEDAPVESTADTPPQSAGPAVPDSSISAGSQEESGDAMLEEYMSSLMSRVRGGSGSYSPQVEPQLVTPSNQPTASDEEASPQESLGLEVQAEAEIVEPLDLNSLKNASQKPPLPTDMGAMRELANSSARQAIAKYSKRRHLESGFSTFLICGISTGVAAYMMLLAESFGSPLFLGGLIPAFVGLLWGVKLLRVLLDSIREGSGHKSNLAEISIDEAPLPIDGRAELDSSDE